MILVSRPHTARQQPPERKVARILCAFDANEIQCWYFFRSVGIAYAASSRNKTYCSTRKHRRKYRERISVHCILELFTKNVAHRRLLFVCSLWSLELMSAPRRCVLALVNSIDCFDHYLLYHLAQLRIRLVFASIGAVCERLRTFE